MCGRYTLTTELFHIKVHFGAEIDSTLTWKPRYNIAPTQEAPIVISHDRGPVIILARFGLIPSWAKDAKIASSLLNARSETVEEKPSFREAFKKRRCMIPADSFFEWKANGKIRQPYLFRRQDRKILTFAGLWEKWKSPEGSLIHSFSILTTEAQEEVAPYHHRMPVLLPDDPRAQAEWLSPTTDPAGLKARFSGFSTGGLEIYPVSTLANSPVNDRPEILEPV